VSQPAKKITAVKMISWLNNFVITEIFGPLKKDFEEIINKCLFIKQSDGTSNKHKDFSQP
jgi:hypothetical protein